MLPLCEKCFCNVNSCECPWWWEVKNEIMAEYSNGFDELIKDDEGKTLTNTAGDRGGRSFCGISEPNWPNLSLWEYLTQMQTQVGETCPEAMPLVKQFYKTNFWDKIGGDYINDQAYANKLFSDAVNFGLKPSIELAEEAFNLKPTGVRGTTLMNLINA